MTLPVYETMGNCAAATGIPLPLIKHAKKSGCLAFIGPRVHLDKLLPWLFKEHESQDALNWGDEFKKWQSKREKQKFDKEADALLDRASVEAAITRAQAIRYALLERMLLSTLPPDLKGKSEHAIRERLASVIEEMRVAEAKELAGAMHNEPEESESESKP